MAENSNDNIDDLLVKVVLEEASDKELAEVMEWISRSNKNRKYFEDFKHILGESKKHSVYNPVDEKKAWQDFQQRIQERQFHGEGRVTPPRVLILSLRRLQWVRFAAALIILLGGGWFYYYNSRPEQFLSAHTDNQVLTDTLPEGAVVTLNKASSIRYKRHFSGDTRWVEMEGEAFFSVRPDKEKPFVVHAGGASVTVIGTSFNIKVMVDSIEVIVETGKVEIAQGGTRVGVRAHERAIISKGDVVLVQENDHNKLYNYYRTNEFECEGTPLWRIVEKLNEVYKVHIVIGDQNLKDLPLTVTFRNESLDKILNIIAATFKSYRMTVVRRGGDIILN